MLKTVLVCEKCKRPTLHLAGDCNVCLNRLNRKEISVEKPNCYNCVYRGDLAGDSHSCCNHPAFKDVLANPVNQLMAIFASLGRSHPVKGEGEGIEVVGDLHGIRRGWFNHPFNFDPTWLVSCTGFKSIEGGNNASEI